jgi:hypothetical protein
MTKKGVDYIRSAQKHSMCRPKFCFYCCVCIAAGTAWPIPWLGDGLDNRWLVVWFPAEANDLSLPQIVKIGSGSHRASYSNRTCDAAHGNKAVVTCSLTQLHLVPKLRISTVLHRHPSWHVLRDHRHLHFRMQGKHLISVKRPIHSQLNWAILLCDVIPDGKTE